MSKFPLYSQHLDVSDKDWQNRACGIVALKTLLDYLDVKSTGIDSLIKEGLEIGAYQDGVGWIHKGIVDLANMYGAQLQAYDWSSDTNEDAYKKLLESLGNGPLLISMYKDFNPNQSGHLAVLINIGEDNSLEILDPDSKERSHIRRRVSKEMFLRGWKKRAIVPTK